MKLFKYFLILLITMAGNSFAKVQLTKIDFSKGKDTGKIIVHYQGTLKDYPEMEIVGKAINVLIPNADVKKNLEKSVSFSSNLLDTQIRTYQSTKKVSKIKALLPFNIQSLKDKVSLTIKESTIELVIPRKMVKMANKPKLKTILPKKVSKKPVKKEFLNEDYLNKLLDVKKPKKEIVVTPKKVKESKRETRDSVSLNQAAPFTSKRKTSGSQFSLVEYGGKFVAFLGFVLLLFYGLINLMKKGFIKKGKLGFLNNADQISVVSQTYIGPKKSLMLIRAHNQVFLVSNTDNGIHPISEIKDAAGLFKEGERALSGQNFDTNLDLANIDEKNDEKIVLKKDIMKSNQQSSLSSYMNVKEKVSFSDQLKKKVKNLKPLQ